MAITNLTGQKTAKTFKNLMQISSSGEVFDGLGNLVTYLKLTADSSGISSNVIVEDEGNVLTSTLSSLNFSGSGVEAIANGDDITIIIPGGTGASTFPFSGSAQITGSLTILGSLQATNGITGSLFGTSSWAVSASWAPFQVSASYAVSSSRADSASYALTASYVLQAVSSSYANSALSASYALTSSYSNTSTLAATASYTPNYVLNSTTSSMLAPYVLTSSTSSMTVLSASYSNTSTLAATASYAPLYLPLTGGTINGNVTINGTASIALLNVQYESASVIYSSGSNVFGDATNDTQTLIGTVLVSGSQQITGSLQVTRGITGSLFGTASYATNIATASNILGGKATHIPYFITDTTLATSSLYQSGSTSVIINQDNNTEANPEALYVYQPHPTSFNIISGKGNLDNYAQLNVFNTNTGNNASADIVATADNGSETTNYIDMGINGSGFTGAIGDANDAYLYSAGQHLHIGNTTPTKPIQFFVGGADSDLYRKFELNANGHHNITGSLEISGGLKVNQGITGSLFGTASYSLSSSRAISSSYALTASNALTASFVNPLKQTVTITGSLLVGTGSSLTAPIGGLTPNLSIGMNTGSTGAVLELKNTSNPIVAGETLGIIQFSGNDDSSIGYASSQIKATVSNGPGMGFPGGGNIAILTGIHESNVTPIERMRVNDLGQVLIGLTSSLDVTSKLIVSGSTALTGSLQVTQGITGSLFGTASYISGSVFTSTNNALSASYSLTASFVNPLVQSVIITGSLITTGSNKLIGDTSLTGSLNITGSTTQIGNNTLIGNTILSGSIGISGSSTIQGATTMTGSLLITGSTIQIGNNTLLGNTLLSGSIVISGSVAPGNLSASVNIFGDTAMTGFLRFNPYSTNIDTSISASYIFVSGSTNDLYFSQNGEGYANTTRLRWLEGNLYTGLLNGGILSVSSSTVYNVSSGSGIIVNLNGSYSRNPYPTIQYINWNNLSASIAPLSASFDWSFVAINSAAAIEVKGTPYEDGEYNTKIPLGLVLHQNRSTINGVQTFPSLAYGWKQRTFDFMKAFGPLKISGYGLSPSGSSTRGLLLAGGISWVDGRNYTIDPNNPSYITEAVGIATSKIFRYHQSGSQWVYDTNGAVGYTSIDPSQYSNSGVLTPVPTNDWSIQRVYYFPNSATKALFVYYGNDTYSTQQLATAAIGTEAFAEAPNTAANAIFIGYMVLRYNADFTVAASYAIQAAGLFRGSGAVGGSSGGGTTTPGGLTTQIQYNNAGAFGGVPNLTWDGTTLRATGSFNGSFSGSFTGSISNAVSASYALTASYALNGGSGGTTFPYTGNAVITGSLTVTGSTTSTEGFIKPGAGSQYLLADGTTTAGTGGSPFPYTGSAIITGSLQVTGSVNVSQGITGSLFGTASRATTSSHALTAASAPLYLPLAGGFLSGDLTATNRTFQIGQLTVGNGTTAGNIKTDAAKPIGLWPGATVESARFLSNGNTVLGTSFINTGSFRLQVSSSVSGALQVIGTSVITGSLTVTQGITGSLFGTASYAVSGGLTLQQVTSNGATTTNSIQINTQENTSGLDITCNQDFSNGIGISTLSTANSVNPILIVDENRTIFSVDFNGDTIANSLSTGAVYANEFVKNGGSPIEYLMADGSVTSGSAAAFPYTGTAVITGSLVVTSTIQLDGSLTDYATVNSSISGPNNLYNQATGSYTATFVKYTVSKGTNSRAGEFIVNWNDALPVEYTDVSTRDIGNTADVVFSSTLVTGNIQVNATTATSGWKIKTLATFI
jgi:hypothetical protein